MKVIYSPLHRDHAPKVQLYSDGVHPAVEVPARAERILAALEARRFGTVVAPRVFARDALEAVHDGAFLAFLAEAHGAWRASGRASDIGLVPDTFAMRSLIGRPENRVYQAGYYCFETQTPILEGTWKAAQAAAWCALTGAEALLEEETAAYALCRPPGHHAGRDLYGGYCYLNNAALAVQRLSGHGRVTVLDVDYHHGNGTQAIFYASDRVQFVSLHADPNVVYPHYCGYANETGEGPGKGATHNFPLPVGTDDRGYLDAFARALQRVATFDPDYLVVSLGVDIFGGDPLSRFAVSRDVFAQMGRRIHEMRKPVLFVQEGGYDLDAIGDCVGDVLEGFEAG